LSQPLAQRFLTGEEEEPISEDGASEGTPKLVSRELGRVAAFQRVARVREIFGDNTELEDPHGIALDTQRNLLFVSNHGHGRYRERGGGQLAIGRDRENEGRSARQFRIGSGYFAPPSITVYSRNGQGNVPPCESLKAPKPS
jgi:hypothetical protein